MDASGSDNLALAWMRAVRDSDLPSTTKLVLLTLGTRMDPDGSNCFPSIDDICSMTSLTNRTVISHLDRAEDAGWLERGSAGRSGQGWKRHRYLPRIPEGGEPLSPRRTEGGEATTPRPPESGEADTPRQGEGGESLPPKAVKQVHSTSTTTSSNNTGDEGGEAGSPPSDEDGQPDLGLEDGVARVWRHYVDRYAEVYSPERADRLKLTAAGRDGHLRARLREGYTPEELCRAIDGCFGDDWHREKDKVELEYIVRNQSKVEDFLNRADRNGGPSPEKRGPDYVEGRL